MQEPLPLNFLGLHARTHLQAPLVVVVLQTQPITAESRPDDTRAEEDQVLDISAANSAEPFPSPVRTGSSKRVLSPGTTRFETTIKRSGGTFGAAGGDIRVVVKPNRPSAPAETGFTPTILEFRIKGKGRANRAMLTSPPSAFRPNPIDNDHARSSVQSPPSPLSPAIRDHGVIIPALEIDEPARVQEFNDDVSYRLQLLVKNNYFLPPAHSKPYYFRVGKSRSKPASPDPFDGSPMLRVTSDSTTVSGYIPRGAPQTFRSPKNVQHLARVVVVREKMDDLVAAAKQAEIDLKGRDVPPDRDRVWRRPKVDVFDGIIDPRKQLTTLWEQPFLDTLSVLIHEKMRGERLCCIKLLDTRSTIQQSRLLCRCLRHRPPLRGHRTIRPCQSHYISALLMNPRKMLEQKIIENPIVDHLEEPEPSAPTAGERDIVARLPARENVRLSSYTPLRAETPVPQTPLAPPSSPTTGRRSVLSFTILSSRRLYRENTHDDSAIAAIIEYISSAIPSHEQDDRADWFLSYQQPTSTLNRIDGQMAIIPRTLSHFPLTLCHIHEIPQCRRLSWFLELLYHSAASVKQEPCILPLSITYAFKHSQSNERHKPVSNVLQKTPYFTNHSQEHLTQPDTPGSENVRRWQKEQQALAESSKRLDGMLIQHMEAEKDTLRRIAQTAKVSKP
ncbi:hypothetical protein BDR07DRAFT_1443911 [Suillus spraguei]|nr:hypothetical protein BDR07DRAFT_1443911 [Suillus spraguei]